MDESSSDRLPPELDELGKRISMERPVASDHALDRIVTRNQRTDRIGRFSLWRAGTPRTPKKRLALVLATLAATVGMAGVASALTITIPGVGSINVPFFPTPPGPPPNSGNDQYACPTEPITVFVAAVLGDDEAAILALVQLQQSDAIGILFVTQAAIPGLLEVTVCVSV